MDANARYRLFALIELVMTLAATALLPRVAARFPKDHPFGPTVMYGISLGAVSLLGAAILVLFTEGWRRLAGIAASLYLSVMVGRLLWDMLRVDDATLEAWTKDPARKRAFDVRVLATLLPGLLTAAALMWPLVAHVFGYYPDGR
jgi:hypothetical protein